MESQLRQERNEIWSRFALAAREDSLPPQDLCEQWSAAADLLLQRAFDFCFEKQKVALFSLGKLGSAELNLSSDVDLLLVSDETSSEALSALRKFQKILTERTSQGFVFRVDLDLRPGGRQGPILPTLDQFRDYYGNYGETWERLAFVRLRPIAGDPQVQDEVLSFARKFSFRRHLDFTLLEDLKTLRTKIQTHYWERSLDQNIDLKLGVGGIRDVELFTHALQVIHGGRDTSLQICGTTKALQLLEYKGLLPCEEAQFLRDHYWNLRRLENYVQAVADQQTHLLDAQARHPEFVKAALKTLTDEMVRCDSIVKSLLGEAPAPTTLEEELKQTGLESQDLEELWREILGQQVLSRNRGRDELSRKAFLSAFLETLHDQKGDPRRALLILKDFIAGTRAKASFFTLLLREKSLLQELAWLFGHSPYLSRILCNRPELLDSFVYRAQSEPSPDLGILLEELTEKKLLSEVINGSEYLEDRNVQNLNRNLTSTADSIVTTLTEFLRKEFPSDLKILTLGKWGGQEMGFRSDLDFIFVLPEEPGETDFKFAKRLITRLTESRRGGNIYSIDMRLRPSGKAGPLIIQENDLRQYLATQAAPWERQAYLRARWLAGGSSLLESCFRRKLSNSDLSELEIVRQQLVNKGPHPDLKYSEGGLVDIELAAQTYILQNQTPVSSTRTADFLLSMGPHGEVLRKNYDRLRQVEQMLQLVASESLTEVQENHESFQSLAIALHTNPSHLFSEIHELFSANTALLKELDPRRRPH